MSDSCATFVDKSAVTVEAESEKKLKIACKEQTQSFRSSNEDDLIANAAHFYNQSLSGLTEFNGPPLHFHVQSIREQETSFLSDRHIEMMYAALTSWGLHCTDDADNANKMVAFPEFKQSILDNKHRLHELYHYDIKTCTKKQYTKYLNCLDYVYCALNVSQSDTTIAAHSKSLALLLPNLIPSVDTHYTIRFFTQDKNIFITETGKYRTVNLPVGIRAQLSAFKKYCIRIKILFDRCNHELFEIDKNTLNTSYPRIMNNMIIAYVKDVHIRKKTKHDVVENYLRLEP